jgi:hypothetical protein
MALKILSLTHSARTQLGSQLPDKHQGLSPCEWRLPGPHGPNCPCVRPLLPDRTCVIKCIGETEGLPSVVFLPDMPRSSLQERVPTPLVTISDHQ